MRILLIFLIATTTHLMAQDSLPFREIPAYPSDLSTGNTLARMVQGLGYRYYWATEDLRAEDLAYRPTAEASSSLETLQHLYGLAEVIAHTAQSLPNIRPAENVPTDYPTLRRQTLAYLDKASALFLGKTGEEIAALAVVFDRGGKLSRFPVWHLLNGPLADALYHTGQVVSFRRTSGNPLPAGVNVFMGKTRN